MLTVAELVVLLKPTVHNRVHNSPQLDLIPSAADNDTHIDKYIFYVRPVILEKFIFRRHVKTAILLAVRH
jgi:hypothetical protein